MTPELGAYLMQRRKALGLRRDQVSTRAAVGYDWYVKIEQGRGRASRRILQQIATALELDPTELEYILALADQCSATAVRASNGEMPPSVLRVMHLQEPAPAYIANYRTDLLAWNRAAPEFYAIEFDELPPEERNILWLMFTSDALRDRIVDSERHARRLVKQCRSMWAGRSADPAINCLVDRLKHASELFRSCWALPMSEVVTLDPVRKAVQDPELGLLTVEQTAWQFGDKSDHILILSVPLDNEEVITSKQLAALIERRARRAVRPSCYGL